nr:MAG TPA: hypothetical protein [Caudoviricetes sp.]
MSLSFLCLAYRINRPPRFVRLRVVMYAGPHTSI